MTRILRFLVASVMAACSSTVGGTATPDAAAPGGETCAPEAQCRGCATCFDGCLCGGGTAARCAESCNSEPDAGTGPDASVAPPRYTATVVTNAFDIPPGQEFFRCQDFANPFGRDVAVLATESFMTAGSHHMFVFQKPGAQNGDLEPCSGLEFQRYLHLSQRSQQRLAYPPGVGLFFGSGNGLRVQIHYLNVSTESVHTEIAVTIRADDPQAVPVHAGQIFINTLGISVPPFSAGTADQDCTVPHDVNVFMAASHMHQHATHFISRASDGQLIYETNQWAEPAPWVFSPPRKLKAGESIHIHCDYRNDTATPLSFGESAASNEMCILAGSYYPASDGESITCLF